MRTNKEFQHVPTLSAPFRIAFAVSESVPASWKMSLRRTDLQQTIPRMNLYGPVAFQGLREADFSLRRGGWSLESNDSQHQATELLPNLCERPNGDMQLTRLPSASTACISSSPSSSSDSGKSRMATNPVPVAHGVFFEASNIYPEHSGTAFANDIKSTGHMSPGCPLTVNVRQGHQLSLAFPHCLRPL